jgi:hypothetical protein
MKRKGFSPSLPTEEERVGERSLVLLDFPSPQPSPHSYLAWRGSTRVKCIRALVQRQWGQGEGERSSQLNCFR